MKDWVKTIDDAAMAVIIDERKDNKLKKLASFRNRSPTTGQSPATKPRKPSGESLQPLVNKDKKNWKGKMVKQLKRMGGGGGQGGPPGYPEGGSIGVPLEECPFASEYLDTDLIIPYLVKVNLSYSFLIDSVSFNKYKNMDLQYYYNLRKTLILLNLFFHMVHLKYIHFVCFSYAVIL